MSEQREDLLAVGLDLAVIVAFAAGGRANHGEGTAVADIMHTALPFAAAALMAHLLLGLRHRSTRSLLSGLVVWGVTILGGLAGRLLLGESAGGPFALVAAAILAAGMFLWRLVIVARSRMRSRRPTP